MIDVFILEDHTLVRQSLVELIDSQHDMQVIGAAATYAEAVGPILTRQPDVALLDVGLPGVQDGLDVAQRLRDEDCPTAVMLLTMHEDTRSLHRANDAGVRGYLTKVCTTDEVVTGVRSLAAGGSWLSPTVASRMMDVARGRVATATLTERETVVLLQLAQGRRMQQIADDLALSAKTVKNHLSHVYAKLGVESGAQAVVEAYRLGLVHI